jgi:hypothetical protein
MITTVTPAPGRGTIGMREEPQDSGVTPSWVGTPALSGLCHATMAGRGAPVEDPP